MFVAGLFLLFGWSSLLFGWVVSENRPIGKTGPLRRVRSDVVVAGAVYFGVSLTRLAALSCLEAYKSDRVPVGTPS
jgi:hypothetical protein